MNDRWSELVPLQIPAGYGQMNLIWQVIGGVRPCEVTLGYHDEPGNEPAEQAQAIWDDITAVNRPCAALRMGRDWTFLGVRCMQMTESGPVVGEFFQTVTGTGAWDSPSLNLAVLIRKNTASGGRANRGRLFVPPTGISETGVNQLGALTSSARTQIQGDWDAFKTALAANPMTLHLYHNETAIPTTITSLSVQSLCATQRRRMRK